MYNIDETIIVERIAYIATAVLKLQKNKLSRILQSADKKTRKEKKRE